MQMGKKMVLVESKFELKKDEESLLDKALKKLKDVEEQRDILQKRLATIEEDKRNEMQQKLNKK
jgi:hypothetical protein